MTTRLEKIEARRIRKEQQALEQWQQVRTKGKLRFVIETAMTWGLTMTGVFDVIEYFLQGKHSLSLSAFCFYLLIGIGSGFGGWSSMEGKYQKALNKGRKTPPDPRLRITP
ncbi:MAG TPA: hypothetical protein VFI24_22205 [Pyrinomonadaceae bacterium]|nr:hypothetical protein [Pyrinomonadaceae bacterium]